MRKITLEQRVARLEKLFNSKIKKSRKFEGLHPDMLHELQTIFDNHFASPSYYGSKREFQLEMEGMADGANDMMVDDAIIYLVNDYGYNEDRLESARDDIADSLSQMARVLLDGMDEYDESHKRPSRKSVKNEDAKMMPNGMIANRVSDVLSGWAEVSRNDVNGALKALDRAGALDRACNRWYPTVDDIMAAVEDCWDDPIAMVGNGAAQFFISNNGDCALILQPIAGGSSRARQITLKFHWDV
jgi:hypothetical protein